MTEWVYTKFRDDFFMLMLNLPYPVQAFEDESMAKAMWDKTRQLGTFQSVAYDDYVRDENGDKALDDKGKTQKIRREIGLPQGPLGTISAWRGDFKLPDGIQFRISAIHSVHNHPLEDQASLGLVCLTHQKVPHNEQVVREWVASVNEHGRAKEEARVAAPTTEPLALIFKSGELGGGRFGFASEPNAEFVVSQVAGSLDGATGVYGLYEARPGDGEGTMWVITEPGMIVNYVHIRDARVRVLPAIQQGSRWLYKADAGTVPWPSRDERTIGVSIALEIEA